MPSIEPIVAPKTWKKTARQGADRKYQRSDDPENDISFITLIGVWISMIIILTLVFRFLFEGSVAALIILLTLFIIPLPIYYAIRRSRIDEDLLPELNEYEGSEQIDPMDVGKYSR